MSISNMKIASRLAIGFAATLVLLIAVAAIAIIRIAEVNEEVQLMTNDRFPKTVEANKMIRATNVIARHLRNAALFSGVERDKSLDAVNGQRKILNDSFEKLEKTIKSSEGLEMLKKVNDTRVVYRRDQEKFVELLKADKKDELVLVLQNDMRISQSAYIKSLDDLIKYQVDLMESAGKEAQATVSNTLRLLVILTVVAALLAGVFGWLITRSITRPIAKAMGVAEAISAGDLSTQIDASAKDETGALLSAMARMQAVITGFVAAQKEMKVQHDAGTISYRIDDKRFAGSYGEMASMTNELVSAHIAVKMRVVDVVSRYAKGDLSVDMDRLPGEKARITEVIDGVKASLQAVNVQIQTLVDAAGRGDYTVRGDEDKFEYEFRKMVAGLNQLMRTSDTGLREVSQVLSALAKGDLTEKMTGEYQGAFGQLKDDANQTVENLTAIVNQIKEASETIDTASKEITQGNTDLSQRTEEQASSLEETASSMEELTSTVKQNAENARQANQLAVGASDVAVRGGDVVKQVVTTMSGITESSKKIADIIGVIDGIAFQTNILALNAAVEAARAGEQGRGFAVVASEVRNLAQRSANAAKEIKELITESVNKVDAGSQLVDQAGKTMNEVVDSVKRVTDIMAEITAASQEQSSGIEQVNQAITQMDEVTQQNAALVEQAAAAAESMQEQSGALVQTVATFKLGQSTGSTQLAERRSPGRPVNVSRLPARAGSSEPGKSDSGGPAMHVPRKKVAGTN